MALYTRHMETPRVHVPTLPEEVAPYVNLSHVERATMLRAVCRAGARIAMARPDTAQVFAHRDPLSAATEAQLARLMREFRSA